jgi:precorrin-6Y C5,15-methyltransferase (decarboxylating)
MITKMPIRLLSLQALDLPRRTVLWDIGFCTGSISIEARLLFPHLQVEAFEIRPECEAIIHENARRFGAPGIAIHIGDFCSVCCDTVAAPDAVFIGGHGGQLKAIMAKACRYLRPGGVIVMNAVTVSPNAPVAPSRLLFDEACRELGLIQHPAMHIEINDYHPIDILKCELPS